MRPLGANPKGKTVGMMGMKAFCDLPHPKGYAEAQFQVSVTTDTQTTVTDYCQDHFQGFLATMATGGLKDKTTYCMHTVWGDRPDLEGILQS